MVFIVPQSVVVENGNLVGSDKITAYPDKHWRDNVGYKIVSINIANPGTEYKNAPFYCDIRRRWFLVQLPQHILKMDQSTE
jgi:hypothetical protein